MQFEFHATHCTETELDVKCSAITFIYSCARYNSTEIKKSFKTLQVCFKSLNETKTKHERMKNPIKQIFIATSIKAQKTPATMFSNDAIKTLARWIQKDLYQNDVFNIL